MPWWLPCDGPRFLSARYRHSAVFRCVHRGNAAAILSETRRIVPQSVRLCYADGMSGQRRSRHGGTVDGWRGLLSAGLHVRPSTPMLVAQCALLAALLTGCSLGSDPPATTHPMT